MTRIEDFRGLSKRESAQEAVHCVEKWGEMANKCNKSRSRRPVGISTFPVPHFSPHISCGVNSTKASRKRTMDL